MPKILPMEPFWDMFAGCLTKCVPWIHTGTGSLQPRQGEKQHLADKGSKWLVPDEWNKDMPQALASEEAIKRAWNP